MAILQVNYMSQALWRIVPLQVILPADKADREGNLLPLKKYKTLYLLGGMHGCQNDWVVNTRIRIWAEERNLAVVMPAGENSFYVDQADTNSRYGEFVGREIVEITRRMFPLSDRREDTFIGGLSMGGYGALRAGLKYSDTFGAIISLSGALHVFEDSPRISDDSWKFGRRIFGLAEDAMKSDNNPRVLLETLREAGKEKANLPKIFMACGTEDFLLPGNRSFKKALEEYGLELTYIEAPGDHNWFFWDAHIKEALDWLPLDEKYAGMDSGNIARKIND